MGDDEKILKKRRVIGKWSATSESRRASKCYTVRLLPDHLLSEILIRLPDSRHAIRCTAVCKSWRSLISEPYFADAFIARHAAALHLTSLVFQSYECPDIYWASIDPRFYHIAFAADNDDKVEFARAQSTYLSFLPWEDVAIRASCHDLLLLSRPNHDGDTSNLLFYICNPTSKAWYALPEPSRGITRLLRCGLVFKNDKQVGYDVVLFCHTTNYGFNWSAGVYRDRLQMTVFCSQTARWTPLAVVLPPSPMTWWRDMSLCGRVSNKAIACDGLLYWLLESNTSDWGAIIAFDPIKAAAGQRCFQYISCPADAGARNIYIGRVRLGTCQGRLRAASMSPEANGFVLRVWELSRRGSDDSSYLPYWSVVYSDVLRGFDNVLKTTGGTLTGLHPSNPNIVFLRCTGCVFLYNMLERKAEKVGDLPPAITNSCFAVSLHFLFGHSFWPTPVNS